MEKVDDISSNELGIKLTTGLNELEGLVHSIPNIDISHNVELISSSNHNIKTDLEEFDTIVDDSFYKSQMAGTSVNDEHKLKVEKYKELVQMKNNDAERAMQDECRNASRNFMEMSMVYAECSNVNQGLIDDELRMECELLFEKGIRVSGIIDCLENLLDEEFINMSLTKEEIITEIKRLHLLNNRKINEYLKTRGHENTLGHIVHRLLSFKYPRPKPPPGENLPWLPVMALLHDLNDSNAMGELNDILNQAQVKLILFEDALEACIEEYRKEGPGLPLLESRDPPLCIEKPQNISEVDTILPHALLNEIITAREEKTHYEKETQTCPEIMPILSFPASLGKQALEKLRINEELSDWLKVAILIEYLKVISTTSGYVGWVLVDFPKTFEQISLFEESISGRIFPNPDCKEKQNISKVTVYQSKIVPDPSEPENYYDDSETFKSTFTCVVTVTNLDPPQEPELLDYVSLAQEVYIKIGIHHCFHCASWTDKNLNSLAELLLVPVEHSLFPKRLSFSCSAVKQYERVEFTDFDIPNELALGLSSLWESLEIAYLTALHRIYFRQRAQLQRVKNYILKVRNDFMNYLRRQDSMQQAIEEFQYNYTHFPNSDNENDVKVHHSSVDSLQNNLISIGKLNNTEEEQTMVEISTTNWLSRELGEIINITNNMMQIEIDRYIDTMALLQDYFLSSLQSLPPDASKSLRFEVGKTVGTNVTDEWSSSLSNILLSESNSEEIPEEFTNLLLSTLQGAEVYLDKMKTNICSAVTKLESVIKPKPAPSRKQKVTDKTKNKKKDGNVTLDDVNPLVNEAETNLINKKLQLLKEWIEVCEHETELTKNRLKLTCEEMKTVSNNLIDQIRSNIYMILRNTITKKYKADCHEITTLCEFLHMAIETGAKLEKPIILQRHFDNLEIFLRNPFDSKITKQNEMHKELDLSDKFFALIDIFHRIAPDGFIANTAFSYILNQAAFSTDNNYLPEIWSQIENPEIIIEIISTVSPDNLTDWRKFLLHLLNLSPLSQRQLLLTKHHLKEADTSGKGSIDRNEFLKIKFWFEQIYDNEKEKLDIKNIIFNLFSNDNKYEKINYYEFLGAICHDTEPALGFAKALSNHTKSLIDVGYDSDTNLDNLLSEINLTFNKKDIIEFEVASKILVSGTTKFISRQKKMSLVGQLRDIFREVDDVSLNASERRARQRALATKVITQDDLDNVSQVPTKYLLNNNEFIQLVTPAFQTIDFNSVIKEFSAKYKPTTHSENV